MPDCSWSLPRLGETSWTVWRPRATGSTTCWPGVSGVVGTAARFWVVGVVAGTVVPVVPVAPALAVVVVVAGAVVVVAWASRTAPFCTVVDEDDFAAVVVVAPAAVV